MSSNADADPRGLLFVVSAPSATGKTTVVEQLVQVLPGLLMSRSYTSRPPRSGEEDGLDGPDGAPTWIIDPIDGTSNFVKGNPIYATLIACSSGDRDIVGVVSAPALGSRWDGVVGEGARQDGHAIRVSAVDRLADAEVSVGAFSDIEDRVPGLLGHLAGVTARQRGYGDFWAYCLLASGSTDAVVEARLNPWDLAAVRAVVEAAGGRVTDFDGIGRSDGGSAVATNGLLHDELLGAIAERRRV